MSPVFDLRDLHNNVIPPAKHVSQSDRPRKEKTVVEGILKEKYDPFSILRNSLSKNRKSGSHYDKTGKKLKDALYDTDSDDAAVEQMKAWRDFEKNENRKKYHSDRRKSSLSQKTKRDWSSCGDLIDKEINKKYENIKTHDDEVKQHKEKIRHGKSVLEEYNSFQLPIYDPKSHKKDHSKRLKNHYFSHPNLSDIYNSRSSRKNSPTIDDERTRYEQKLLDINRNESKKALGFSKVCRNNHILKSVKANVICDICSECRENDKALYCGICNYAVCALCKSSRSSRRSSHHGHPKDVKDRTRVKTHRRRDADDDDDDDRDDQETHRSYDGYGQRGRDDGDDEDDRDDDDDDGDDDDGDENDEDENNDEEEEEEDEIRPVSRRHGNSKYKKGRKYKKSSSDSDSEDYGYARTRRGRSHHSSYRERREEIGYKYKVLGPLKPYRITDNFRDFFNKISTRIEYLGFSNQEARIHLLEHIFDDGLRANIAQVFKDNPACDWSKLGTKLFIALGVKSKTLLEAESHNLDRKEGESVNSYAMRLRDLKVKMAMCSKDGESFVQNELFEKYLLADFLRGLKSTFMVNKVIAKEASSVQEALVIIESELAKEKKKEYFNQGTNFSLTTDKQLFSNPQSAKFFSNNNIYQEGELTFTGDVFSIESEEVNEISPDVCKACGNAKDHNGGTCRAKNSKCLNCGKLGHFVRMCQAGRRKPEQNMTTTTPAQIRFQQKQQRKKIFNKKINQLELSDSGSDSDSNKSTKEFGQICSDSEIEFRNGLFALMDKRYNEKKKTKKEKNGNSELRRINILEEVYESESVNSLHNLPFLHCFISDFTGKKIAVKALYDSGASVSVLSKKFLEDKNLVFEPITYNAKLCGFGGSTTNTNLKGKFSLSFGTGETEMLEFVIFHSDKPVYDMIIGFDLQKILKFSIDLSNGQPKFLHKGKKIPSFTINDKIDEDCLEGVNTVLGDDKVLPPIEPNSNNKISILADTGATLRGNDNFFLPVTAHDGPPGIYKIKLNNEKLMLLNDEVALVYNSKMATSVNGILSLKFKGKKHEMLSLKKFDCLGEGYVIEAQTNQINIEFCHFLDVEKKMEDKDKILIYPVRKTPTPEELEKVKKAQERRRKLWTKELVLKETSEWMKNIPERYKEDVLDLVLQYSEIFVHDMRDLEEGLTYFELDAYIPPHLPFIAAHKKRISVIMEPIYKKSQENMLNSKLAENALTPLFVHPYSLVQKKGCKFPATQQEAESMSHEFCRKSYRIVMDASFLTKYTKNGSIGYTPELAEAIGCLEENTLKSFFDLSQSFHQINLSSRKDEHGRCIRDLFSTYSYLDGIDYLRSRKLTMGFCNSSFLSTHFFKTIVDIACAIPLNTSVPEFVETAKKIEKGCNPPLPNSSGLTYPRATRSYIDDCFTSSPKYKLEQYHLTPKSFFRPPVTAEDKQYYLHLQLLAKNFAQCQRHNLLLELRKTFILTQDSFDFLGFKFERIKELLVLKCPDKKLEVMRSFKIPKSVSETQSLIGFFSFFSILIRSCKQLMKPLIDLIRKDRPYKWTDVEQYCFDELKRRLEKAVISGYLKLTNGSLLQEIIVFVDWSKTTSSAGACVFVKEFEHNSISIAYFWSRLLSDTFKDKPPFLCELGLVVLFLLSNRYLIAGRMVTIWSDNLVATSILRRRLEQVDAFDNPIVNRLLVSIANYPFQVAYVNTKSNVADFVSRQCHSSQKPFEEILNQSVSISDLGAVDKETYQPDSSIQEYLDRNKKNANLVRKLNSKSFDVNELKMKFQSSHVFQNEVSNFQVDDPLESILKVDEIPKEEEKIDFEKKWTEKINRDVQYVVPSETAFPNLHCTALFDDSSDPLLNDFFHTGNNSDLIHYLIGETKVNPLHPSEMTILREDTTFMLHNPDLLLPILNGMNGLIDNEIMDSRLILGLYLQEVNVIHHSYHLNDKPSDPEPLFNSWDEIKRSINDYKLADFVDKKMSYFTEIQNRSKAISLMKQVLENTASEEEVNLTKRTSALFNDLFNAKESLFIKNSLLFKIRFPKKGEKHNFCLVLEETDAERKLIQLHSKHLHRGYIFLFSIFSINFYALNALKMSYVVVSQCPACQQMRPRRKLQMSRLNISTARLTWGIDHKGPTIINSKTRYVLCCVELNIRLCSFSLAKTTNAAETAQLFFDNVICVYGGAVEIVSDRSKSFLNELFDQLVLLGGSRHRVTSSYSPWCNATEERAVRKLSNAIRAVSFGRSTAEWASNLKYLQLLINSTTISPYLSSPPFALLFGSENSFFHPILVVKNDELPFSEFWNKRIRELKKINDLLVEKYDIYLSQKSNKRHTVDTLGLKVGDLVWVRCIQFSSRLKYMKHLLPKWKLAEIVRINGMTSLLLKDKESGKIISRHLQDVAPVKPCKNYANLYQDSWNSHQNEVEEDFGGKPADEIPALDGRAIDDALDQSRDARADAQLSKESWKGRLRNRRKVDYRE